MGKRIKRHYGSLRNQGTNTSSLIALMFFPCYAIMNYFWTIGTDAVAKPSTSVCDWYAKKGIDDSHELSDT